MTCFTRHRLSKREAKRLRKRASARDRKARKKARCRDRVAA